MTSNNYDISYANGNYTIVQANTLLIKTTNQALSYGSNRMSLGGINGIRAYSTLDGVGDQGVQMSFDIIHQIVPDVYGGLFYDVGVIKNNHSPLSTATDTHSYLLQGTGWQVGGKIQEFNWTLSAAHSFGKTPGPGVWTALNTRPGDFRVNFSLTRPF